jgi:Secretion system C-terminal sorting domain
MKKIYLIAISFFALTQVNAQAPTLTKANSEPIIGDTYDTKDLDTTNVLPMNIAGTGVTWNVTGLMEFGGLTTNTFIPASADPSSASYPGTNIVQSDGNTTTYYKSTATTYELLGVDAGQFILNYSGNSAIISQYPISFGYSNTDMAAGTLTANAQSGTFTGTIQTIGDATGTLDLNGVTSLANCLRVKTTQITNFTISFIIPGTIKQTFYNYYHSSSKWPVFTVNYSNLSVPSFTINQTQTQVSALSTIAVGIKENDLNNIIFKAYPNPASNQINIHYVLTQTESYTIDVLNTLGQIVKTVSKPNLQPGMYNETIDITGLNAGIYTVKVNGNRAQGTQKIIVE